MLSTAGLTDNGLETHSYTNHIDILPTLAEGAMGLHVPPCPTGRASLDIALCTMGSSLMPLFHNTTAVVNSAAYSQYPRGSPPSAATAVGLVSRPTYPSLCLSHACVMGYSVLTVLEGKEWRYTEWVEFNGEVANSMAWDKNYGSELYAMTDGTDDGGGAGGSGGNALLRIIRYGFLTVMEACSLCLNIIGVFRYLS